MPKYVQVEGGPRVAFPDDATEEEITRTLNRDYPPEQPPFNQSGGIVLPPQFNADDNLARAARDFQDLKAAGMVGNEHPSPPSGVAVTIGKASQAATQAVKASLADAGEAVFGPALAKVYGQPDAGEPPSNIEAFAQGQPLPAETQLRVLPKPLEVAGRAAQGLVGSAPQMAAIMGAEAVGVPPLVSGPIIFGSTPEGFSPQQAAIAAALPFVGRYGGEIAGAMSRRLGISSSQAENIFKGLGGSAAAAGLLAAVDLNAISKLPEDQKHAAMVDAVANAFSQAALGPLGVKYREPSGGEVAAQLLSKAVSGAADMGIEGEAAAGGIPQRQEVTPKGRIPGAPRAFTPETAARQLGVPPEPEPAMRQPRPTERPTVPEGPDEERISAVEEIRRANARTTRQIQELFPKAQLSNEQARAWRVAAWGAPKSAEQATAPAGDEATGAGSAPPKTEAPAPASKPGAPAPDINPQRVAATKKLTDFLRSKGIDVDSFLQNPYDHVTEVNLQPDGSYEVRIEHHTEGTVQAELVNVKAGESLSNPGRLEFVKGKGTRVRRPDGTLTDPLKPAPKGAQRFIDEWNPTKNNKFSNQVGLELSSVDELDKLLLERKSAVALANGYQARAEKETDPQKKVQQMEAWMQHNSKAQLAREAIEVGLNAGSWDESQIKLGPRPLDWRTNPKAKAWLLKHAEEAGITLPKELRPQATGPNFTVSTPLGTHKVTGHWEVVDAFSGVTTSTDLGYDPSLQPRDRSRVASQQDVATMNQNFEAERLGQSLSSDQGAPLADASKQVLSGWRRTQVVRQRYRAGQGNDYRDFVLRTMQQLGMDTAQAAKMEHPLLVRVVDDFGKLTKEEFARQSNQQQVAGMSEAEKAAIDARLLLNSPGLLNSFRPGDSGDVLAASNRDFLNAFIKGTGDQAELLSREGYNGPVLAKRVRNAVLGALIGPENRALLNQLLEESDRLNLRNSVNGVMATAPALMRFKGTPYDLSTLAGQAFKDLVTLRTTGQKLEEFLDDRPLLTDDARTAESDLLLKFLAKAKSSKAVTDGLLRYAEGARHALQDAQSGGIFGGQPATRAQLIERASNAKSTEPTETQGELSPTGSTTPPNPPAEPQSPPGEPGSQPKPPGPAAGQGTAPKPKVYLRDLEPGTLVDFHGVPHTIVRQTKRSTWLRGPGDPPQGIEISRSADSGNWRVLPPPSGQGGPEQSPPGPSQAPSLALEEAYNLNPAEMATQSADRALREEQQRNDPGLREAQQSLAATSAQATPAPRWFTGLRRIFAAGTIDKSAEIMAGIVRHALGLEYKLGRQADFALRSWRAEFDKTPVGRNWKFVPGLALPRNYEVMRAIDTGEVAGLTPLEAEFAHTMRKLFDQAIDLVQSVSPESLQNLIEHYFPRIWQDPVGNADKINQLLSSRPWEGPKSFLRKRVLEYFTDGLARGLKPVSDNPVDVALQKLGEMYRFTVTRQAMEEAKQRGLRKFFYAGEKAPPGWREVDDPSSTVWGPPSVTIKEAFDAQRRAKTIELLEQLGVPHERLVKMGGKRWGEADPMTGGIVTKFGGPDAVLWHEFGHQMDWRYPELRQILPTKGSSTLAKELRALADLRFEGQKPTQAYKDYVRQAEEKIANVFDAYLRAPKLFQETAPNVWRVFNEFLDNHPELKKPLDEIEPSLTLGVSSAELRLGGFPKLGKWMMPEGAAQVVDNYLKPGLGRFKAFRTLRELSGLVNGIQLAGFFHGGFVMNDAFFSGFGLAAYDALQAGQDLVRGDLNQAGRKFGRAAVEIMTIPVSPALSLFRGGRIKSAIENPEGLPEPLTGNILTRGIKAIGRVPQEIFNASENRLRFGGDIARANEYYRQISRLAVDQNLRAGHGNFDPQFSRRWSRAFHEALAEPSTGAVWETFWRTPMALVQTVMKPVMDYLVPRMKLGIAARMAERVITDNPNAGELELRRQLALAADATEDRLGQVTYDNLFQNRVVKDVMQLAMRAYGWQLTKYRLIFGGAADWVKAGRALAGGRAPEITFRMTYLPAMVMGHAVLGAVWHYALTGRRPTKLVDLLFPESGLVDAFGQPVRLALADFVKDMVADFRNFPHLGKMASEFSRKLAPFWNMGAEMYRNEDFWGTEIFTRKQLGEPELDHVMRNLWEGIQYVGKSALPFSVKGSQRLQQSGATRIGMLGPLVGVVPAPRYATQTPAEARAAEIMRLQLPKMPQTKEQAAKGIAEAQIVRDIRTGKINKEGQFEAAAKAAGINYRDQRELTKLRERVTWSPMQYQVHKMTLKAAMEEVFDLANEEEKVSLAPILADKINNAFNGGRIDAPTAKRYVALVLPFFKKARAQARAAKAGQGAAAPRPGYSAFNPQTP